MYDKDKAASTFLSGAVENKKKKKKKKKKEKEKS